MGFRLDGGTEMVTVRSGDSLLRGGVPRPTFMKVDIEGAEAEMLRGATAALATVDVLVVAVHSRELYDRCVPLLQALGFDVHRDVRISRRLADPRQGWHDDPDLVAVRPHSAECRERVAGLPEFEFVPAHPQRSYGVNPVL